MKLIQLLSTVTVRFAGTAVTENGMLKEMVDASLGETKV